MMPNMERMYEQKISTADDRDECFKIVRKDELVRFGWDEEQQQQNAISWNGTP